MNPVQELAAMDVPLEEILAALSPAGLVEWNGAVERARVQRLAREIVTLRSQVAILASQAEAAPTIGPVGPVVEHTSPPTIPVPEAGAEGEAPPTPVIRSDGDAGEQLAEVTAGP